MLDLMEYGARRIGAEALSLSKCLLSHLIQSRREAQLIDKLQLIAGTGMKELAEQLSQLSRRSVDY